MTFIQIRAEQEQAGSANILACFKIIQALLAAEKESRFQLDKLLDAARPGTR